MNKARMVKILVFVVLGIGGSVYADTITPSNTGYVNYYGDIVNNPEYAYLTQTTTSGGTVYGYRIVVKFDISELTSNVDTATIGLIVNMNQMTTPDNVILESITTANTTATIAADYTAAATPVGSIFAWQGGYTGGCTLDIADYINEALDAGRDYVAFRFKSPTWDYWPPAPPTGMTTYNTRINGTGANAPFINYTVPEPATMLGFFVFAGFGLIKHKYHK